MTVNISLKAQFDKETFKKDLLINLKCGFGKKPENATAHHWYHALARTLTEMNVGSLVETEYQLEQMPARKVNYLSMEFLIGRMTGNNLIAMDIHAQVAEVMAEFDIQLTDLLEEERDPALGNGGLGRLAACFLDSLVALEYPAVGYGLHYQYGLFRQSFENGEQRESPDKWRDVEGYPCEIIRPEFAVNVGFFGHIQYRKDEQGNELRIWEPSLKVEGQAYDIPVVGYKNNSTYPLRLWECHALPDSDFDFNLFNQGDYFGAQQDEIKASNITKILYPNDNHQEGKVLRLMQQYFLTACSIKCLSVTFMRCLSLKPSSLMILTQPSPFLN